jgi:hypothetical protein
MSEEALTSKQANEDALEALLAARFGRTRGRPAKVESWPLSYYSRPWDDWMRTDVTVGARLADEALRAMLTLPGGIMCHVKGGTVTLIRDRSTTPVTGGT